METQTVVTSALVNPLTDADVERLILDTVLCTRQDGRYYVKLAPALNDSMSLRVTLFDSASAPDARSAWTKTYSNADWARLLFDQLYPVFQQTV
jgi:hypothetical protein